MLFRFLVTDYFFLIYNINVFFNAFNNTIKKLN